MIFLRALGKSPNPRPEMSRLSVPSKGLLIHYDTSKPEIAVLKLHKSRLREFTRDKICSPRLARLDHRLPW